MQCAPGVTKRDGSCMPKDARKKKPRCETDRCVAAGSSELSARLRPDMPRDWTVRPTTLLNTNDIDRVMFQYERKHRHFKYLKTLPIDAFERSRAGTCISAFCDLDPREYARNGKTLLGMVLNLDRHNQRGSHWVMLAIDMREADRPELLYYDSFGRRPPATLMPFFKSMLNFVPATPAALEHMRRRSRYNAHEQQHKNTECGVYSMLALEAVLAGTPFDEYCSRRLPDDFVQSQRLRLYNTPDEKA